jgi:hypothetical protein
MVIFVEQKSFASVVETPEEQVMSDFELRNECLKYLNPLRGRTFINKATGIPIEVNRELRNEMIGKIHISVKKRRPTARIKFLALKIISYLLTDSDPDILGEPDSHSRSYVLENHVFKYKCKINGILFRVKVRTRKLINTENRLYFLGFEDLSLEE